MEYSRQQSSNIMHDFSFLQKVLPDFYMCLWTCCFRAMDLQIDPECLLGSTVVTS